MEIKRVTMKKISFKVSCCTKDRFKQWLQPSTIIKFKERLQTL